MVIDYLIMIHPTLSIIVIGFLVTLVMTLVTKFFTNQVRMKELKEMQKHHQKKVKEHKGNFEKQKEIQSEIWKNSMELMQHSFKPMIITFLPIILTFWWIRHIYAETSIATTWFWWYLGSAIISSIILRKVLDVA